MNDATRREPKPPLVWVNALMFLLTAAIAVVAVPWYAIVHGFALSTWVVAVFFTGASGMAITAGYHRLWAHRTYDAHWSVRLFLLVFGTMALQNSVFAWASGHRTHHLHVDDDEQGSVLGAARLLVLAHRLDAARVPERP